MRRGTLVSAEARLGRAPAVFAGIQNVIFVKRTCHLYHPFLCNVNNQRARISNAANQTHILLAVGPSQRLVK